MNRLIVRVYRCTRVSLHVYICIYTYIYRFTYLHICVCVETHGWMDWFFFSEVYACVCMCTNVVICMKVCVCTYVYIHEYVWAYRSTRMNGFSVSSHRYIRVYWYVYIYIVSIYIVVYIYLHTNKYMCLEAAAWMDWSFSFTGIYVFCDMHTYICV